MMQALLVSGKRCLVRFGINPHSGSAIAGTNSSWIPHKGVLSPAEKALYISTSDGAGPYDGTLVRLYGYFLADRH